MLNLNTYLSLEVVKQNKQLQEIETCWRYFNMVSSDTTPVYGVEYYQEESSNFCLEDSYTAPTIADIISNAEKLFGDEQISTEGLYNIEIEDGFNGVYRFAYAYNIHINKITRMCQQDKPLKEIEDYIVNNLRVTINKRRNKEFINGN